MARIATIDKKEDLAPQDQKFYDAIVESRGTVGGPWRALLHSPELAQRTMHLGSYVRFESSLDHRLLELSALVAARELDCKHEWAAHIRHAEKAGIPAETVRSVYEKKGVEHFSSEDAQVVSFVREILRSHKVSETTSRRERFRRACGDGWLLCDAGLYLEYFRCLYRNTAQGFGDLDRGFRCVWRSSLVKRRPWLFPCRCGLTQPRRYR
jgi:4-carboxymuconolactone decarboxylase